MSETSEAPIVQSTAEAPPIPSVAPKPSPREVSVPENAQGRKDVDLLIVFGQGPVKPLFVPEDIDRIDELCKQKGIKLEGKDKTLREEWEEFKLDPLHNQEPDFRVLEGKYFTDRLKGKDKAGIDTQMAKWQKVGRLGLNRYARQNALTAGLALTSGYSKEVLISGGRTLPPWAGKVLSPERIKDSPSEAELFADIIRRRFGSIYEKRYGRKIDEVIKIEGTSTNTLLNFANSMNENPSMVDGNTGLLGADFHAPRILTIAKLFAPEGNFTESQSAQQVLQDRIASTKPGKISTQSNMETYKAMIDWMVNPNNQDYQDRAHEDQVWHDALIDPEMLNYWLGYIGVVEDPRVLQKVVERLSQDAYRKNAVKSFQMAGLNFDEVAGALGTMSPEEFRVIADKLKILTTKDFRTFPDEAKNFSPRLVPADSLV